ncbi:T9SS type B sorting domain-containing protein [Chitinophaga filiformis]|nr:gliding motility-associated C-terminal domain-containing protein [Chitinophaga filiformis]
MRSFVLPGAIAIFLLFNIPVLAQQASFTAPDTVCVGEPVVLTNTSTGGSTFYWNFCTGNLFQTPDGVNLGDLGTLSLPVFVEMAKEGNNYYAFVTDNSPESLVRLDFGNSFLNTPVVTNLGNFAGNLPTRAEGLQIVQDADGWHIIVVGDGVANDRELAKLDFGSSLANTPVCTNWGNIGNLAYPIDLYMFQVPGLPNWYGMTVNSDNNTITRFDFGTSFNNPPTAVNLGNLGNLDYPTGIYTANYNGNWYVFITNGVGNTITRLDFGNSLLNTPVATNLGNPGGLLQKPRDIYIINDCGGVFGLVANGDGDDILRLEFAGGNITGNITATSYGNIANFRYPHSLSSLVRIKDDLYTFVTNPFNHTVSRVKFSSCTSSSIPSSTLAVPPSFVYNQPGTYTVNMIMNEGLSTQQTTCRNIVVVAPPVVDLGPDVTTCNGSPVLLNAGPGFSSYKWSDNSTGSTLTVNSSGTYSVVVTNGGSCTATDDVVVNISPVLDATLNITMIDCRNKTGSIVVTPSGGIAPFTYTLNGIDKGSQNSFTQLIAGTYTIGIKDNLGCTITRQAMIGTDQTNMIGFSAAPQSPSCEGVADGAIRMTVISGQQPFQFAIDNQQYQTTTTFNNLGAGTYKIYGRNNYCLDSTTVTLTAPTAIDLAITPVDETCTRGNGELTINANGGAAPYTYAVNGVPTSFTHLTGLSAGNYNVMVTDANGCRSSSDADLKDIDIPAVTITNNDTTISLGDQVQLHAINAPDYAWMPVEGLSCVDCASPVAQPMQRTTYVVTTVTGLNCIKEDRVTIYVDTRRYLFVPTAFTPNKDGVNDVLRVRAGGIAVFRMSIYNRWGNLIFSSSDLRKGWDGTYQNELQPNGVFVYMIEYAYYGAVDKLYLQKGTVTLIR